MKIHYYLFFFTLAMNFTVTEFMVALLLPRFRPFQKSICLRSQKRGKNQSNNEGVLSCCHLKFRVKSKLVTRPITVSAANYCSLIR